jgi:hypothetical protein
MPKQETVLRVFVASPGDVAEERRVLEDVIRELNVTWSGTLGIRLDLIRWETHANPGFAEDPQQVINEQIPAEYDIFIGIMWARFGTPTKRAGSGTVEEFENAYERHKVKSDGIEIMFYFKNTPISPNTMIPAQLEMLLNFKSGLGALGGLYYEFSTVDEFRSNVRLHLSRAVQKWAKRLQVDLENSPDGLERQTTRSEIAPSIKQKAELSEVEEEGFVDLMETATDSIEKVGNVLTRMGAAIQDLTHQFEERTVEAQRVSNTGTNLKAWKRITTQMADDLQEFVTRMEVEIPIFGNSFATAMDSFGRAAALSLDFGNASFDNLRGVVAPIELFRDQMRTSYESVKSFQSMIEGIPRMSTSLSRARRNVLATLDKLLNQVEAGLRQIAEVEALVSDIIRKS